MALPSLAKTWQFNVNNAQATQGSALADNRKAWRAVKNALKGFGTLPWTVVGSSDSSTAGLDTTDRWAADSNLVWGNNASVAHSWIVLKQTGLGSNFQILIDFGTTSASGNSTYISYSPSAGYTGGSTTTRPTSTDEVQIVSSTLAPVSTVDAAMVWHAMQSTDGQSTRIIFCGSSKSHVLISFEKAQNVTADLWTSPVVGTAAFATIGTEALTLANLSSVTTFSKGRTAGGTNFGVFMTVEGWNASTAPAQVSVANELMSSPAWPFFPIGIASNDTGARGKHATFADWWWGSSTRATGDDYPSGGTHQFAQFGNLIFPWSGSAPVVA